MATRYATKDEVLEFASNAFPDNLWLARAVEWNKRLVPIESWGEQTFDGHCLIVAHYALMNAKGQGGSSGVVTGRTMGQISESYQQGSDDDLCRTEYGRQFMALRKTIAGTTSFSEPDRGWALPGGRVL